LLLGLIAVYILVSTPFFASQWICSDDLEAPLRIRHFFAGFGIDSQWFPIGSMVMLGAMLLSQNFVQFTQGPTGNGGVIPRRFRSPSIFLRGGAISSDPDFR